MFNTRYSRSACTPPTSPYKVVPNSDGAVNRNSNASLFAPTSQSMQNSTDREELDTTQSYPNGNPLMQKGNPPNGFASTPPSSPKLSNDSFNKFPDYSRVPSPARQPSVEELNATNTLHHRSDKYFSNAGTVVFLHADNTPHHRTEYILAMRARDEKLSELIWHIASVKDITAFDRQSLVNIAELAYNCLNSHNIVLRNRKPQPTTLENNLSLLLKALIDYNDSLQKNMEDSACCYFYSKEPLNSDLLRITKETLAAINDTVVEFLSSRKAQSPALSRTVSPAAEVSHDATYALTPPPTVTHHDTELIRKNLEKFSSVEYLFDFATKLFEDLFSTTDTELSIIHLDTAVNLTNLCALLDPEIISDILVIHDFYACLAAHLSSVLQPTSQIDEEYKALFTTYSVTLAHNIITFLRNYSGDMSGEIFLILDNTSSHYHETDTIGVLRASNFDGSISYRQLYLVDVTNALFQFISTSDATATVQSHNSLRQVFPAISMSHHVAEANHLAAIRTIATLLLFQNSLPQLICFHSNDMKEICIKALNHTLSNFLTELFSRDKDFIANIQEWLIHDDLSDTVTLCPDLCVDKSNPGMIIVGKKINGDFVGKTVEFHVGSGCTNISTTNMEKFTNMLVVNASTENNDTNDDAELIGIKDNTSFYYTGQIARNFDGSTKPCPGGRFKYSNQTEWITVPTPPSAPQTQQFGRSNRSAMPMRRMIFRK